MDGKMHRFAGFRGIRAVLARIPAAPSMHEDPCGVLNDDTFNRHRELRMFP